MASETKGTPQKEQVPQGQDPASPPDRPLLDLSDAVIKKLIRTAKKRGYVTQDQINSVLPPEKVNSEQIEDVLATFLGAILRRVAPGTFSEAVCTRNSDSHVMQSTEERM
jgi:hypothetical protein